MSLAVISSLELARRKFFMNSTESMCKNLESNVLRLRSPKCESTSHQLARISKKKIFHELDVHIV